MIEPVLIPEPGKNTVVLGDARYEVRPLSIGRLKRAKKAFQDALQELLQNVATLQGTQVDEANVGAIVSQAGDLLDLVFDSLPALFCAFIPDVDPALFEDDDGPTVPQLVDAATIIVRVNGFDRVPNFLRQATANR